MVDGTAGVRELLQALLGLTPRVRFVDFLKATVLLSAGSATLLAAVTVIGAPRDREEMLVLVARRLVGGRRADRRPGSGAARGLAADRAPARRRARRRRRCRSCGPALTLINRLWPLLISTLGAAAIGVFVPQVSGVAAGFAIIWALAWRRQDTRGAGDRGARRLPLLRRPHPAVRSRSG